VVSPCRPVTRIVADHRERASGVPERLAALDLVDVVFADLPIGDYVVDGRVVFERKTIEDFAASIIDTRLFRQASRLHRAPFRSAFLVEGTPSSTRLAVSRGAMQGALVSLSLVFGVPVLRAVDKDESARLIVYAARQLAGLDRQAAVWRHRKPRQPWSRRLHVLQSLPGIGRDRAARLLERFGTIERCLSADEAELRKVPGIGARTARAIRRLVSEA
jgi:ERCC4-type nuclease